MNPEIIVNTAVVNTAKTEIQPLPSTRFELEDYIPFGSDNLFPQAMSLFSRTSPNHRGIINTKNKYVNGLELKSDSDFHSFITVCNKDGESLSEVLLKIGLDYEIGGNAYLEIIKDYGNRFVFFNHIDFTKCRKTKDNKKIIINPDWTLQGINNSENIEIPLFPVFEPDKKSKGIQRSIYHFMDYEPEFPYYGIPSWIAGKDSVQIDIKTNRFNLARLINSFKISGIMFVPVKDANESAEVIKRMQAQYTGDMNQDKLLILTKSRSTEGERAEQVQLIQNNTEESGSWLQLHELSISDLITAHSWYRSLSGIADNTGFDTQRILNEYQIAMSNYIQPRQMKIKGVIKKIFKVVLNKDIDFEFLNKSPVGVNDGLYLWELRRNNGLEFDENDIKQQKIIFNGSLVD